MVINTLFFISILIVLIQIFLPYEGTINILILFLEIIILIYLWFRINKKWNSRRCNDINCNHLIIEIMRKFRHDMLNNIQIISCYATLKRNEDIINQITTINYIAIQQSLIASFSNETFAAYFYKIHALFPNLIIELEIEEDINIVKDRFNERLTSDLLDKTIKVIYLVVDDTIEQHLSLFIGSSNDYLIINLEFEGSIAKVYNKIHKIEKKMIRNNGKFVIGLNTDQKFIVDMHFPLKKV